MKSCLKIYGALAIAALLMSACVSEKTAPPQPAPAPQPVVIEKTDSSTNRSDNSSSTPVSPDSSYSRSESSRSTTIQTNP